MKKIEKLAYIIQEIAAPLIIEYTHESMEDFWVVSVVEVTTTSDYSYADIYVTSQNNQDKLPAFLSDFGRELRWIIWRKINTRKIPIIRFRIPKIKKNTKDITDLINEISKQYDLN